MKLIISLFDAALYFIYHFFATINKAISKLKFSKIKKIKFKKIGIFKKVSVKFADHHDARLLKKYDKPEKVKSKKKRASLKSRMSAKQYESFLGYAFVSPWIVGALLFTVYPIISVIKYSFETVLITNTGIKTAWLGLDSYINVLFINNVYKDGLKTVFTTLIIQIPIIIVVSILFAVLLNSKLPSTSFFRTLFFLPVIVLSGPVLNLMTEIGVLGSGISESSNLYTALSSLDNVFTNIILYLITNIESILWFSAIPTLVFLVIIQQMNFDLYEAADMDGASASEKFWKVTLPQLKMGININIIYLVMFMGTFSSNPIVIEIKDKMFSLQHGLGYASTEAIVYMIELFVIIIILMVAVNGFPKIEFKKQRRVINE